MYEYRAIVQRVVDGDTIDVWVDLGFRVGTYDRLRLAGINAPELHDPDPAVRAHAEASRAALTDMVSRSKTIIVQTKRDETHTDPQEKYGRYLADLFVELPDGTRKHVNSDMVAEGFAVPFMV